MKEINDSLVSAGNLDSGGIDTLTYWKKKIHLDNPDEFAPKNKDLAGLPCPDNIWKEE